MVPNFRQPRAAANISSGGNKKMFIVHLRPERGIDGVKALRWILKRAQRLGLKCISAIEEKDDDQTTKPNNEAINDLSR
jgi:hypothetical protein